MADYINRKAVVGILEAMSKNTDCCGAEKKLKLAAKRIGGLYAPEVVPVVHGHWTEEMTVGGFAEKWEYKCSVCGKRTATDFQLNYCPYCGAKMDEV